MFLFTGDEYTKIICDQCRVKIFIYFLCIIRCYFYSFLKKHIYYHIFLWWMIELTHVKYNLFFQLTEEDAITGIQELWLTKSILFQLSQFSLTGKALTLYVKVSCSNFWFRHFSHSKEIYIYIFPIQLIVWN